MSEPLLTHRKFMRRHRNRDLWVVPGQRRALAGALERFAKEQLTAVHAQGSLCDEHLDLGTHRPFHVGPTTPGAGITQNPHQKQSVTIGKSQLVEPTVPCVCGPGMRTEVTAAVANGLLANNIA